MVALHSPLLIQSMATQKLFPAATTTVSSKMATTVFPLGEPGPQTTISGSASSVKLLTRVEQLRLLTKAEKAGLLSAADKFGLSLPTIERLGLLSKAEELGVLSAATDPGTPSLLSTLSLLLLVLGPSCVYMVPEDYPWEIALQVIVALLCVIGGSAAFASQILYPIRRNQTELADFGANCANAQTSLAQLLFMYFFRGTGNPYEYYQHHGF